MQETHSHHAPLLLQLCAVTMLAAMAVVHREDVKRVQTPPEAVEPARESLLEDPTSTRFDTELGAAEAPAPIVYREVAEAALGADELRSWERTRDRVDFLAENHELAPLDGEPARSVADFVEERSPWHGQASLEVRHGSCDPISMLVDFDLTIWTPADARTDQRHLTDFRYFGEDQVILRDANGVQLFDCADVGAITFEMRPGFAGRAERNLILRRGGDFEDATGRKHTRAELAQLLDAVGRTRPAQPGLVREPDVDWVRDRGAARDDEYALVWIPGSEWVVAGTNRAVEHADAWYVRRGSDSWCTRDPEACAALIGLFAGAQR